MLRRRRMQTWTGGSAGEAADPQCSLPSAAVLLLNAVWAEVGAGTLGPDARGRPTLSHQENLLPELLADVKAALG